VDGGRRSWVIAAARPAESANDGNFTQALIDVLGQIRDGEFGVAPACLYVPLSNIYRALRQEVNRLSAGTWLQTVTVVPADPVSQEVDLGLFPNTVPQQVTKVGANDPHLLAEAAAMSLDQSLDHRSAPSARLPTRPLGWSATSEAPPRRSSSSGMVSWPRCTSVAVRRSVSASFARQSPLP
jgi:hypothetical protein